MQIGAVLPHNEIGTDPGAIKAYAQGLEELGIVNVLLYDHVLGADPDRPGGWKGAYDKDVAFHEPFSIFPFIAAVTTTLEMVTAVLIHGFGGGFLVANASLPLMLRLPARLRALGMGGFTAALYLGQFASPIVIIAIAGPLGGMPPGLPAAITLWAGAMALLAAGCAAVAALRPAPRPLPLDGA